MYAYPAYLVKDFDAVCILIFPLQQQNDTKGMNMGRKRQTNPHKHPLLGICNSLHIQKIHCGGLVAFGLDLCHWEK